MMFGWYPTTYDNIGMKKAEGCSGTVANNLRKCRKEEYYNIYSSSPRCCFYSVVLIQSTTKEYVKGMIYKGIQSKVASGLDYLHTCGPTKLHKSACCLEKLLCMRCPEVSTKEICLSLEEHCLNYTKKKGEH